MPGAGHLNRPRRPPANAAAAAAAPHRALLAQHSFDPEALWGSAETLQAAVRRTLAGARGKACPPSGGGDAATDCAPVFVFINGLFDGGVAGPVRKHLRRTFPACRFISLHCGAVSSVRDRAVECFWELRGGRIDYQVDGAVLEHGHSRFGEEHPGLLPSWGADSPIHIFAFSLGATTARCLQHLLERGVFADKHGPIATSGAWYVSPVTDAWPCAEPSRPRARMSCACAHSLPRRARAPACTPRR